MITRDQLSQCLPVYKFSLHDDNDNSNNDILTGSPHIKHVSTVKKVDMLLGIKGLN